MNPPEIQVRGLTVGPLASNCYLVRRRGADRCLVVDPGAEPGRIADALAEWDATPVAILLTHAHLDHVGGVAGLAGRFDLPVWLHPADRRLYDSAADQAAAFGLRIEPPPPPDHELEDGGRLELAGLEIEVRHTPGHSPGGVVFVFDGHALVGDCVFRGSVGRVDLPGGDGERLLSSIRNRILDLPAETVLWPGHGPETRVRREATSNPFLTGAHPLG